MVEIITAEDLPADVRAAVEPSVLAAMIAGANARAGRVAPCLASTEPPPTDDQVAEAKLILIGAIGRWAQAGSGAVATQAAGPFSMTVDSRQPGGYRLWPSEIEDLQAICKGDPHKAFSVDTAPSGAGVHLPWCSINFGTTWCSCGVDIAGEPIYELGGA